MTDNSEKTAFVSGLLANAKESCIKRHEVTNDDTNILTATVNSPEGVRTTNNTTVGNDITLVEDSKEPKEIPYSPSPETSGSKEEVGVLDSCEVVHGKAADTSSE